MEIHLVTQVALDIISWPFDPMSLVVDLVKISNDYQATRTLSLI